MTSPEALRVVDASFEIDGKKLVDSIHLDVPAGGMVGIVGPNGSGKSTFVRLLYRALAPTSGAAWIGSDDLLSLSAQAAARRLAAVPQEAAQSDDMRVSDMVLIGRIPHRRGFAANSDTDRQIVSDALAHVGMLHFADRRLHTLSGGERQRVVIARALAQQPGVIVLDEPTNHLDLRYQHDILSLLRALPLTVVVVLHDVNLAASYCDDIVILNNGTVHSNGPVADVLTADVLDEVFGVSAYPVQHPVTGQTHLLISGARLSTSDPARGEQ